MTGLDRDKARAVLTESLPKDPKWAAWIEGVLDRLDDAVPAGTSRVDVRLVTEAELKLARIKTLCDTSDGVELVQAIRDLLEEQP